MLNKKMNAGLNDPKCARAWPHSFVRLAWRSGLSPSGCKPLRWFMSLLLAAFVAGQVTIAFAAQMPAFSATANGTTTNLTLTASLSISDVDAGQPGNIYLVASTGNAWFVHNGAGWVSWSGGPLPVYAVGQLTSRSIEVVRNANLSTLVGTQVYVGYGLSESDMLTNGKYGLVYTVTAPTVTLTPLITPYVNESDMASVSQIFNSHPDANASDFSLRYVHDGLDIAPTGNLKPFRAACSGRVRWVLAFDDGVNVMVDCDSTYTLEYNFEPQSAQTGQTQLAYIAVVTGQTVSQGDVIGSLYVANPAAHVHFAVIKDWVNNCPEPYFDPVAKNSILNLVHVRFPGTDMCHGGDVTPVPLVTPYVNESDMALVSEAFSSDGSVSPWGFVHDGIDFFPKGNLKPFRAACSGVVDSVQLLQNNVTSNWQVNLTIECNPYVLDPNMGGYFPPLAVEYIFEPRSAVQTDGQAQLSNIIVTTGRAVSQGDVIGSLYTAGEGAHVHFGTIPFGSMLARGLPNIPSCPEPHFSSEAKTSIMNLLHVVWPGANMCYQN